MDMDTVKNGSTGLPAGPVTNEPVIGQSDKPGTDMATPAPAPAAEKEPENRQETKTEGDSTSTAKDVTVSALAAGDAVEPSPKPSDQPSQTHDQPSTPSAGQSHSAATAAAVDVKAEASEHPNAPEASTSNIQQGYVLVAHPDAAGPSGINRTNNNNNNNNTESSTDHTKRTPKPDSFPQDVNDHNNDENGQEVEHYDPNTPPARIQAYARLEFPFFNFYIQKLSVTIGRRPPVSRGASVAPKLQQLDAESSSVPVASSVPVEQRKDADEADEAEKKVSPKAEERERPDGEDTIKVKTEEIEKDEQQPSSAVVAPSAASDGPTVKPEETPRKMNTWEDAQQSNAVAGPSSPTAAASISQTALLPSLVNDEPASQGQPASHDTNQANPASQADQPDKTTTKSDKAQVDVDLGPIKAVSRNHARLFFDNTINSRTGLTNSWSLEVKGRNGLVLDGKWRAKGEVCRLKNGSRIQIAERIFHFVLPNGVGYPTAPPSPIMDEYYEGQPYGYPPTPDRSQSPIIYGSDSDELRSDVDEYGYPYDDDDMDVEGSAYGSANAGPSNPPPPALDENGQPIKRKRGRPKKQRTAEQIAAMELERQRRLDPTIPRRPRGRPPKHKKEENTQDLLQSPQTEQTQLPTTQPPQQTSQQPPQPQTRPLPVLMPAQLQPIPYASARSHAPDIPVPPLVPPDSSLPPSQQQQVPSAPRPVIPLGGLDENGKPRLSKKEQADLRKAQKQAEKEEKQRIKEAEKKAKEEAKAAAKEAKAREAAEKKRKDEERKKAAAEEAKRAAEERHKAIEREKAEKERNKAASAAAAAELKAKTMAEAQARGKAEAEARAAREADNKAKLGGTAGNEIKIRPAPAPQVNIPVQQAQPIVKRPAQPKQPSQQQTQHQQSPAPKPFTPTNQFQGKPEKPPYSYPALIAQAIWSAPNRQAPLQHIHMWIPDKYPFFRDPAHAQILAQAIKQNLAVNRAFVNIPLPSGVALWAIEPEQAKLFDGNTFLPPPNAQPLPYASAPPPPQPQPFYQQQSPYPQQPQYPQQQQQPIQHMQTQAQQPQMVSMQQQQPMYGSPAPPSMPMMSPSIQAPVQRPMNGMAASASPAPTQMPAAMPSLPVQPSLASQAYTQPTASPAPVAPPSASPAPPQLGPAPATSSSSSKMPILIARPSPSYPKPAPPTSAAANDPSSMLDPEGYPPIAIHEGKMYLSPTVFSSLTAQQLSNLQSIETKQALNILQAFVVNYFKTELKKRKKAEKAALKGAMGAGTGAGASGTPMSASPSPAPSGLKRHAADDPMGGNEAKVQKVS